MASVLNDVFGAGATIMPMSGGGTYRITAIFRRETVELDMGEAAGTFVVVPTLRVPLALAQLVAGDLVAPDEAPGASFRVVSSEPSPSPADDRFVMYNLDLVP
jgi:hypothetical protein